MATSLNNFFLNLLLNLAPFYLNFYNIRIHISLNVSRLCRPLKISVYSKENTALTTISKTILTYSGNKNIFWIIQSLKMLILPCSFLEWWQNLLKTSCKPGTKNATTQGSPQDCKDIYILGCGSQDCTYSHEWSVILVLKVFYFIMEKQNFTRQIRRTGSDTRHTFGPCYGQGFCESKNYYNTLN